MESKNEGKAETDSAPSQSTNIGSSPSLSVSFPSIDPVAVHSGSGGTRD